MELDVELGDADVTSHTENNSVGLAQNPWFGYGGCADGPVSSAESYQTQGSRRQDVTSRVFLLVADSPFARGDNVAVATERSVVM